MREGEEITTVCLRDKFNRLLGLIQCLKWVVETKDLQLYTSQPHLDLFLTIEDGIKEIQKHLEQI